MLSRLICSLALALAAIACSDGGSVATDGPGAQTGADAALVGVWQGEMDVGSGEGPFFFVLQPSGAAYFANLVEGGLVKGDWRLEGERILMGAAFDGQPVTFVGAATGASIEGRAPGPDGGEDITFNVARMGAWASVAEPDPASGLWLVDLRNSEDGESGRCGLVLQPDYRAFMTCQSALMTGLWRRQENEVRINVRDQTETGSDEIVFAGALGQQSEGTWRYDGGGGTFTATRAP